MIIRCSNSQPLQQCITFGFGKFARVTPEHRTITLHQQNLNSLNIRDRQRTQKLIAIIEKNGRGNLTQMFILNSRELNPARAKTRKVDSISGENRNIVICKFGVLTSDLLKWRPGSVRPLAGHGQTAQLPARFHP